MRRRIYRPIRTALPQADEDDFDFILGGMMRGTTVFEDDEYCGPHKTGLFGPEGEEIVSFSVPEKQGFIGFICPSWADDLYLLVKQDEEDEEEE